MNQPHDAPEVSGGAEDPTVPRENSLSITNTASDHATVGAQIGMLTGNAVFRQTAERMQNILHLLLPRSVRIAVISLVVCVLAAGGGWAIVAWLLPALAPTYKTEFLIDTTAGTAANGPQTIANSLKTVVEDSGDHDALALRSFGGQCGAENNTTQLVGFGTDNRGDITQASGGVREGSKATLLRGIVQAVEDFSQPFAQRATQVNRVIVVTRHGTDACDDDTAFVEKEIRNRIAAAGLAIEFRLIGYQVPDNQHDQLNQIATAAGAPDPLFVKTPSELDGALHWFTNLEPVLHDAQEIINILNPAVERVNTAVKAIDDGRLDVAENTLNQARSAITNTDTQFDDLQSRIKTPEAQDLHNRASQLRAQQGRVVAAAADLLATARSRSPLDPQLTAFKQVATDYNTEVKSMNEALTALRAKAPAGQQ